MANFSIGLTGLNVAQKAIEIVGTNITNASTEGYHRQDIRVSPLPLGLNGGGGAEITEYRRHIDQLLVMELLRQRPQQTQIDQEISTLRALEAALGNIDDFGLGTEIGNFFNSLSELAGQPNSQAHMEQAAWAGESMASGFRNIAKFISELQTSIGRQAEGTITEINKLLETIAEYNSKIHDSSATGGNTNMLEDHRDTEIAKLSELMEVRATTSGDYGMVNIEAWGMPLVTTTSTNLLETSTLEDNKIGISPAGANYFYTDLSGGKMGGLMNLRNNILSTIQEKFDTLAQNVIDTVNQIHVQGVNAQGPFSELTGWENSSDVFSEWTDSVSAGDVFIRVTNTSTGAVTRSNVITIDPDTHTIQDVANALDSVANLNASINSGKLQIYADNGYKFDFLPAISTSPDSSTITGTAEPAFTGVYSGSVNQTYTFTVAGTGDVSNSTDLYVQVTDGDGNMVANLNVGEGYPAGDPLEIEHGIFMSINPGSLNDGDTFTLDALASSDDSGVIAALGINTFFEGNDADSIKVATRIISNPSLIAASIGPELTDSRNLQRMADLADTAQSELGSKNPNDYFRQLLTGIGQDLSAKVSREQALRTVREQLLNQRDYASGVDVNEEAAKLLMFEHMFQAVSKFISTQQQIFKELMTLI